MNRFYEASGQKISYVKSVFFFSKNTDPGVANAIASRLHIDKIDDLGKYLGVSSIYGRVTNSSYNDLFEGINGQLEGWRAKVLSMAGRVTLAKSVLNAIPTYAMQRSFLHKGVC